MNAEDVLKYGHLTVLEAVENLPESDWQTPGVCGVWSVKDIVAHLASFEHMLLDVLHTLLGNDPTPTLEKYGTIGPAAFNDVEVAARRDKAVAEVLAEYNKIQGQTRQLLAQIPVEVRQKTGTLPWYGAEYALDDYIVYSFYGHKREHSAQIAVFRDTLKPAELKIAA